MKATASQQQPLVDKGVHVDFIMFDEVIVEKEDGSKEYQYESIEIPKGYDYAELVTRIIREHYTADAIEAIILNGNDTPEHAAELTALQAWRAKAKEIAHQVLAFEQ